ncbi:MAG TPA: hypothetical protein VF756_09415, partial [Thermoanaerobaculia bacterium]
WERGEIEVLGGGAPLPVTGEGSGVRVWAGEAAKVRALAEEAGTCVADAQTLCLQDSRFRVSVEWRDQRNGTRGEGQAVPRTDQTGTFWFFDSRNVELVVKVLDGTLLNGKHWFFYGALSDVEYTITVFDTATGVRKRYRNRPRNLCGQGDTAAF